MKRIAAILMGLCASTLYAVVSEEAQPAVTNAVAAPALAAVTNIGSPVLMPVDGSPMSPVKLPSVTKDMLAKLDSKDTNIVLAVLIEMNSYDLGSRSVRSALAKMLAHKEPAVVIATLDLITGSDVIEPLLPSLAGCLVQPNESIRESAFDVIEDVESKIAVDILVANTTNQYESIRDRSIDALNFHTYNLDLGSPQAWQTWWKTNRMHFSFE